jgi:hypothetical protein
MDSNPYKSPLVGAEQPAPEPAWFPIPDFVGTLVALVFYTFAGLLCGSLASVIAFSIAGTLDSAPRPVMCGNTAFEMGMPYGIALGILWGTWKAWGRLAAIPK